MSYDKYLSGFEDEIFNRTAQNPHEGFSDYRTEFLDANDRRTPAQIRAEYNKAAAAEAQKEKATRSQRDVSLFMRMNPAYVDCTENTRAMREILQKRGIQFPRLSDLEAVATELFRQGRLVVNQTEVEKLQEAALDLEVEQIRQARARAASENVDDITTDQWIRQGRATAP
jgi:hypothetical protein